MEWSIQLAALNEQLEKVMRIKEGAEEALNLELEASIFLVVTLSNSGRSFLS
jgi:hypothetical protein